MNRESLTQPYLELDASAVNPAELLELAVSWQSLFSPSGVYSSSSSADVSVVSSYRNSLSLGDRARLLQMTSPIQRLIELQHKHITHLLGLEPFIIGRFDPSCVVFGNGNFFQKHRDSVSAYPERRKYTWVYYFQREPRLFRGGTLRFYQRDRITAEVEPRNGRLIVFRADTPHEVTPVELEHEDFAACRFTLTGFVSDSAGPLRRLKFSVNRGINSLPLSRKHQQMLRGSLRSLAQPVQRLVSRPRR